MMTSSKIHLPLEFDDSIRILELDRFSPSTGLSGRLVPTRLGECPDYIALSYVWGDPTPTESVLLSKRWSHGIPKALFRCLKELSSNNNTIRLWADQICINQDDKREKEHQIRLMSKVYNQARQVVGWLGEATNNSDIGIILLGLLGTVDTKPETPETQHLLDSLKAGGVRIEDIFDFHNDAWKGAISLVQRPWFERLWVVQEVALASTLQLRCGGSTISGDSFFAAVRVALTIVVHPRLHLFMPFQNADKLGFLREQVRANQSRSHLELAHELRGWGCSDDRDRLNALFGIVLQDISSPRFDVSYKVEVEELYESFAFDHITTTQSLGILHFAGDSRVYFEAGGGQVRFKSMLPDHKIRSWAPDWRIPTRPLPLYTDIDAGQPDRFAATCSKPDYSFDGRHGALRVRTVMVDEVAQWGPTLIDNLLHDRAATRAILDRWYEMAKLTHHEGESTDEIFARSLLMDGRTAVSRREEHHIEESEYITSFKHWACDILTEFQEPPALGEEEGNMGESNQPPVDRLGPATRFAYQAAEICQNRSCFITKSGRFGLGPSQLIIGSPIYLIYGLKVPFLLPKAQEGEGYLLRGECYVHGLMDEKATTSKSDVYITLV